LKDRLLDVPLIDTNPVALGDIFQPPNPIGPDQPGVMSGNLRIALHHNIIRRIAPDSRHSPGD
jgi:hypothetical protein